MGVCKIVDNAVAFPNFAKDDIYEYCFAKAKEGSLKMHKYYFAKAKEGSLKMLVSCVFRLTKKLHTQAGAPVSTLKKPSRGNAHEDDTYRKRTSSPFRTES